VVERWSGLPADPLPSPPQPSLPAPVTAYLARVAADPTVAAAVAALPPGAPAALAAADGAAAVAARPPLPRPGVRNILITSALPYVNNVPHLGNIIGCVLSADCYARFARARGHNAVFVCGTDEYGTATETKALEEGTTPGAVCDKYHRVHRGVYDWFRIATDRFGRTPTWHQTAIAQSLFADLEAAGVVAEADVDQLYSEAAGKFLADRFVEGTCPRCGYADARGDQCDGCGALLNPTELVAPRCKVTGTTPVVRSTRHAFLDLPALTPDLAAYHAAASAHGGWSANCVATTGAWMRDGLKPRCITRDLRWGTPVPRAGLRDKVFYVWFDAPIGYISITAGATPAWEEWWRPRAGTDVELIQFMGKDNVPFHTVIFPATLLAANRAAAARVEKERKDGGGSAATALSSAAPSSRPWTLMRSISVTEYLNFEGGKFSKSRGTGVFGDDAAAAGLDADVWRYYLLASRPESADTDFKWADLAARTNSELLANLGNFCHRALSFAAARLGGVVPAPAAPGGAAAAAAAALTAAVAPLLDDYVTAMEAAKLRAGAAAVLRMSAAGNKFLQDAKPWDVLKTDPAAAGGLLRAALGLVALLVGVAAPFVPASAERLAAQVGLGAEATTAPLSDAALAVAKADLGALLTTGAPLGTPEVLFRGIAEEEIEALRAKFGGGAQAAAQAGAEAAPPAGAPPAAASAPAAAAPKAAAKAKAKAGKPAGATPAADAPPSLGRLDLRVGRVLDAKQHPDADSLFVETVDLGGGDMRTVCSGLVGKVPLSSLSGALVVCVCNLKPVAMRGVPSQAMVLAATSEDGATVALVAPPPGAVPGARVGAAGFPGPPDGEVNLKKSKLWPAVAADLATDDAGAVTYKGVAVEVDGGGACTAVPRARVG